MLTTTNATSPDGTGENTRGGLQGKSDQGEKKKGERPSKTVSPMFLMSQK